MLCAKLKEGWRAGVVRIGEKTIDITVAQAITVYVTHPIKGDILQKPVVIINNHLPQYGAK